MEPGEGQVGNVGRDESGNAECQGHQRQYGLGRPSGPAEARASHDTNSFGLFGDVVEAATLLCCEERNYRELTPFMTADVSSPWESVARFSEQSTVEDGRR